MASRDREIRELLQTETAFPANGGSYLTDQGDREVPVDPDDFDPPASEDSMTLETFESEGDDQREIVYRWQVSGMDTELEIRGYSIDDAIYAIKEVVLG